MLTVVEDEAVFKDLADVDLATNEMEFAICAIEFANSRGFDWTTYCSGGDSEKMFSTYPKAWCDHYREKDYCKVDPVCRLTRSAKENVFWNLENAASSALSVDEFSFLREDSRMGICNGISIKLDLQAEVSGVITLSAKSGNWRNNNDHELLQSEIFKWGKKFEIQMKKHIPRFADCKKLTNRQRQCLKYVAEGRSAKAIAIETGLSPRTVEFHLEEAKKRLRVSTIAQAVAVALSNEFCR